MDKDSFSLETMPNDDMRQLAERFGVNFAVEFMEEFAGSTIRIPKDIKREVLNEKIKSGQFGSVDELADEFGKHPSTIYRKLHGK